MLSTHSLNSITPTPFAVNPLLHLDSPVVVERAPPQPMSLPPRVVRRLKLAKARRSLRRTRAAYRSSRDNLGNSNKPGTQFSRSECMSALNRARHALRGAIQETEVLLNRVR